MPENEVLLCPEKCDTEEEKEIILFVCTGNTCRSPMAEALFNHIYKDSSRRAASAGLAADGSPISENAKIALAERGILPTPQNDYMHHVSRTLTHEMIESASLVVGMSASHAMSIIMNYPAYASKVAVMPSDISDPYGQSLDCYRRTLADIEAALAAAFASDGTEATSED